MRTGQAMARSWGLKDFKFLAMPHPIANLTDAELDSRARDITFAVASVLFGATWLFAAATKIVWPLGAFRHQ